MRRRFASLSRIRGFASGPPALAGGFVLPAGNVSDFIDDHVQILVPVVLGTIIVLLGIVMLMQRRSARSGDAKQKGKGQLEAVPTPAAARGGSAAAAPSPKQQPKPSRPTSMVTMPI